MESNLLAENADVLLAVVKLVDVNADAAYRPLYLVPNGYSMIPSRLRIRENSASLAGMDDINIGGGAAAATPAWLDAATGMEALTSAGMCWETTVAAEAVTTPVNGDDATVANRTFGVQLIAGSTGAATVTFEVWGSLFAN